MVLNNIKEIDLLKIDAEGSEYEIVKGCFKNLKNIKIILFEHHYDDMILKDISLRTSMIFYYKTISNKFLKLKCH